MIVCNTFDDSKRICHLSCPHEEGGGGGGLCDNLKKLTLRGEDGYIDISTTESVTLFNGKK